MKKKIGIISPIPDDILKVAKSTRRWIIKENGISKGMCSDASSKIISKIERKYKPRYISSSFISNKECGWPVLSGHCWITLYIKKRRYVLDVTADQFNEWLPKVKMASIVFGTKKKLQKYYNV